MNRESGGDESYCKALEVDWEATFSVYENAVAWAHSRVLVFPTHTNFESLLSDMLGIRRCHSQFDLQKGTR